MYSRTEKKINEKRCIGRTSCESSEWNPDRVSVLDSYFRSRQNMTRTLLYTLLEGIGFSRFFFKLARVSVKGNNNNNINKPRTVQTAARERKTALLNNNILITVKIYWTVRNTSHAGGFYFNLNFLPFVCLFERRMPLVSQPFPCLPFTIDISRTNASVVNFRVVSKKNNNLSHYNNYYVLNIIVINENTVGVKILE